MDEKASGRVFASDLGETSLRRKTESNVLIHRAMFE